MGLIEMIFGENKKKKQERSEKCRFLISCADEAMDELRSIFSAPQVFVEPDEKIKWLKKNEKVLVDLDRKNITYLKKADQYRYLCEKQAELFNMVQYFPQQLKRHNERAADMRIQAAYKLIGPVEGRNLDRQQMICIIKEAHNHLVIAGAGTGKTTTIIGKIKYLLKSRACLPEDLLVLSFTNASASEMEERIYNETGYHLAASTFHKLGLTIISEVEGMKPKISQLNLRKFVKEQLDLQMKNEMYLSVLNSYLLYNRVLEKSEFDFKTEAEYIDYLKMNPPTTISNEEVKSYGEMDIANFLMENSIQYVYEPAYEIDTRTSEYGQYHPDFYLPEYKIYIEYFGVNRRGEVPSYFKGIHGMSATEAYQASMKWKRRLHQDNETKMVECYAYEKLEGTLLESLKSRLEEASVTLTPKSSKELWEEVSKEADSILDGVIELFMTLMNLMKSNGYDIEDVRKRNTIGRHVKGNSILLYLLEPIYNAYCRHLEENQEIDFNDMINLASKYINSGQYRNRYRYVIVDEYQDISKARFLLLDALRKSRDYSLFCVGDDWQSIYRFAGSDIGFILNFEKCWGESETSRIETTYRFSQKLIEISGGFIMKNPAQKKKDIKGKSNDYGFPLGEISGYTDRIGIDFMVKKLQDLPKDSSVFFIGRYSFDSKLLSDNSAILCNYNKVSGLVEVKLKTRPDLTMSFMTAHKSKGLQADYVFIINNKKSRMGFPSKVQDAPILSLLLDDFETYPYSEERRLFYVALTRAKKKAYLLTINGKESEFAIELKEKYQKELRREQYSCPLCGGQLQKKKGPYGEFFGCSNYHKSGCSYIRKMS